MMSNHPAGNPTGNPGHRAKLHIQQFSPDRVGDGHPGQLRALDAIVQAEQERRIGCGFRPCPQRAVLRRDRLDRIRAIPYHPRTTERSDVMSGMLTGADFVAHVGKIITPKGQHRTLTLISSIPPGRPAGTACRASRSP
jgi:hypothetical protein